MPLLKGIDQFKARCPGSAGELMQGLYKGEECLISLPVDCYTEVFFSKDSKGSEGREDGYRKAHKAFLMTLEHLNVPEEMFRGYHLRILSDIPRSKGMSSSTADIAATIALTVHCLSGTVSKELIGKIACGIEPSDSVFYKEMTLFQSQMGFVLENLGEYPDGRVLLLEMDEEVDTINFRAQRGTTDINLTAECQNLMRRPRPIHLDDLGALSTFSAKKNQKYLQKPLLDSLIQWAGVFGGAGVCVAHTGSVAGILYEEGKFEMDSFLSVISKEGSGMYYPEMRDYALVSGGVSIEKRR